MNDDMKAKIDEFLKQNGRRALTLEEQEKVTGGETALDIMLGKCLAADGIRDAFGIDVAADWIIKYIAPSNECVVWFKQGGGQYMYDKMLSTVECQKELGWN